MSQPPVFLTVSPTLPDLECCDPGGLLRRAFAGDDTVTGARDLVLVWLLRLPAELDPALAAQRILQSRDAEAGRGGAELTGLLREIAQWPRTRLAERSASGSGLH
jgi:hypothetical protein